jgi:hypothetical protein
VPVPVPVPDAPFVPREVVGGAGHLLGGVRLHVREVAREVRDHGVLTWGREREGERERGGE